MKHQILIRVMLILALLAPLTVQAQGPTGRDSPITPSTALRHSSPGPAAQVQAGPALHAAGRGTPWINLQDGVTLPASYSGPDALTQALTEGQVQPLTLAAGDFDEDGVLDLVSGYADFRFSISDSGLSDSQSAIGNRQSAIVVHRGNVDAIYPNSPQAQQRKAEGTFTDMPFLSPAQVFAVPIAPDFLGVGDFDNDGHQDVVAAAYGGKALHLLPGDGRGGFGPARATSLPGRVTALVTGEINRRDLLADVVVGIVGPDGPQLLVFEGPEGALRHEPEVLPLPAEATALALGQLDDDYPLDLAIAAGNELLIVHGRDRRLSLDEAQQASVPPARVEAIPLPFAATAMALGDFAAENEYRLELALLAEDGVVHILDPATAQETTRHALPNPQSAIPVPGHRTGRNPQLIRANVSSLPTDDLVMVDAANRRLHILTTDDAERGREGDTETVPASPRSFAPLPGLSASLSCVGQAQGTGRTGSRVPSLRSLTCRPGQAGQAPVSLDVEGEPVAVLPMRLNVDALSDLVVLKANPAGPAVVLTAPMRTFVVNSAEVISDAYGGDNLCDTANNPTANPPVPPSGICTLHAAVMQANASAGPDLITFAISGPGPHSLQPRIHVVVLSESVTIDATTQPGFAGDPLIELDGVTLYPPWPGLGIDGGDSVIRGLAINRFPQHHAIDITTDGNFIEGNFIGIDLTGEADRGSIYAGVSMTLGASRNTIGGTVAAARNVISGNDWGGVQILEGGTDNLVIGNYIGTDRHGAGDVGNVGVGVAIQGSYNNTIGESGAGNVIAGSDVGHGIQISQPGAMGNIVAGNFIGTDESEMLDLGSDWQGVGIFGAYDSSVGTAAAGAGNVIAYNSEAGVYAGPMPARMQGPLTEKPDGPPLVPILIADDSGSGGSVRAAAVSGQRVQRNRIVGNRQQGVLLDGPGNIVGGTTAAARNVISGNKGPGVEIKGNGATENQVQGNYIGVDTDGTTPLGNEGSGVHITDYASNNTVGGTDGITPGTCTGACNLIAFNQNDGVTVWSGTGNAILANSIHSNWDLGIDLGDDGWSRNGLTGGNNPNNWQNFPVLTGIAWVGSRTIVTGTLTGAGGSSYRIEFFSVDRCGADGLMQGKHYLGSLNHTTGGSGPSAFRADLPALMDHVTATATRLGADGKPADTSEFSISNLQITAVEVTQAIQNLNNDVPLIAGKPTFVRAYIRSVGCDVSDVTVHLQGPGGAPPAPDNASITAKAYHGDRPSTAERRLRDESLYFSLPSGQQGTVSWSAEVNPGCARPDAECGDANIYRLNSLTFHNAQALDIRLVPIRYTRGGANLMPTPAGYVGYLEYFRQLYPINRILFPGPEPPMEWDGDLTTVEGWDRLWDAIKFQYRDTGNSGTRVYGVVDAAVPYGPVQGYAKVSKPPWGTFWFRYAAGRADSRYGQWIMLHEVGHTFGRPHPGCTGLEGSKDPGWPVAYPWCDIGAPGADGHWGYDSSRAIEPNAASDFMTYRFLASYGFYPTWVSEYTYRKLHEELATGATAGTGRASAANGESLAARGVVNLKTGAAAFDFMYRLSEPNIPYEPYPGPYTLELQDVAGRAIVTHTFDLDNPHLPADTEAAHFTEWLPYDVRTARVVLKRDGAELASRSVSAAVPTVTVTYPNGGETLAGAAAVRWSAADADGDTLRYLVQYSNDGGATWRTLAAGLAQASLIVDTADLPGGERSLFRVMASDGVNTGQDQSDGFCSVPRKAPSAVIGWPEDGAVLPSQHPLTLWGLGFDPEDGALEDNDLAWTDNISGTLGTGEELYVPSLAPGWHTLILTATDSDGMTGTDSVRVCVGCVKVYLPTLLKGR